MTYTDKLQMKTRPSAEENILRALIARINLECGVYAPDAGSMVLAKKTEGAEELFWMDMRTQDGRRAMTAPANGPTTRARLCGFLLGMDHMRHGVNASHF